MQVTPKVLFTEAEIKQTVSRLAAQIRQDYKDKDLLLIGILKGSFVFLADLIRELALPVEVDFIKLSSYYSGTETSGKVTLELGLKTKVKGRHLLIVEDIIDTGITISFVVNYVKRKGPASLKLCALADKPARHRVPVHIDYLGFTVPDRFIVGYGIDWDEKFRYLKDICYIK
jgi:hypoxanthine phosphoribosyltransferase